MEPRELPMAGARNERADAAANRRKLLRAARELLDEGGLDALRMDAVAAAAGVGKGTVFRRFGDRAGLAEALVDDAMRGLQDSFLHGPAPLGPEAPAATRLEALAVELVRRQQDDIALVLMAATPASDTPPPAWRTLVLHIAELLRQLDVPGDREVLALMLLGALFPSSLGGMTRRSPIPQPALQEAAATLARGLAATGRSAGPG